MTRPPVESLAASDAPADQYERLGLSHNLDEVGQARLLVANQHDRAEAALEHAACSNEFAEGALNLGTPPAPQLAEPTAAKAIRRIVPGLLDTELLTVRGTGTLLQIAGHPARTQLTAPADERAHLFPLLPTNDGATSR
ncbi:hypothetical protein ACFWN5_08980 [Streptomyces sp. NPDC058430]|uniref:hypothetical protein n=1 Tax=Streptomyces sp. NPDC058430 TaxID=3346495 RepID=UPI003668D71C